MQHWLTQTDCAETWEVVENTNMIILSIFILNFDIPQKMLIVRQQWFLLKSLGIACHWNLYDNQRFQCRLAWILLSQLYRPRDKITESHVGWSHSSVHWIQIISKQFLSLILGLCTPPPTRWWYLWIGFCIISLSKKCKYFLVYV